MPSNIVTANTTVQPVAAIVRNVVHAVKSITIDNKAGSGDRQIIVQDGFTPDISANVSSPTAKTISRWQATVLQGSVDTFNDLDLKGVRCIGSLGVIADAIDASCAVTVGYEDE